MNKYGISEATSSVGFKTYAVRNNAHTNKSAKGWLLRGAVFVTAVSMVLSVATPALATPPVNDPSPGDEEIVICHAGNSNENPYQVNSPSKSSIITDPHGHDTHNGPVWNPELKANKIDWGDIIPPFSYTDDEGLHTYAGKNWNTDGQALYNNEGCNGSLPDCDNDPQSYPPDCDTQPNSISITKVVTGDPISDWTFGFTASGGFHNSNPFSLTDESPTLENDDLDTGEYVITENAVGANWSFVSIDCGQFDADIEGQTVTINLDGGDDVSCTFTNSYDAPDEPEDMSTLTLIKALAGDDAPDANTAWTLTADQFEGDGSLSGQSGVSGSVPSGTYDLSETGPFQGYTASDWVCMTHFIIDTVPLPTQMTDGDTVVLAKDANVVCTITNTYDEDAPPMYQLTGKVYHDNNSNNGEYDAPGEGFDGEEGLEDWTVQLYSKSGDSVEMIDSTQSDPNGDYSFTIIAGCYIVKEVVQEGWDQTDPTVEDDAAQGVVNDYEYQVSVGGALCGNELSLLDSIFDLFTINTAQAAVVYPSSVDNLNFGNIEEPGCQSNCGGGSSGGGSRSGSRDNDDDGQILGDSTSIPYVAPQVLGAATELPRTGNPMSVALMMLGVVAIVLIPKYAKTFKK